MTITNNYIYIIAIAALAAALIALPIHYALIPKQTATLQIFDTAPSAHKVTNTVQTLAQKGSCVADALHEELNTQNDSLIADLQTAFPCDQWEQMLQAVKTIIDADDLLTENPVVKHSAGDHPFIKKIREILASYHINPARVSIQLVDTPQSFLAAGQGYCNGKVSHSIKVNLVEVLKRPADVQEAFLRHEIMHLLHYDSLYRMFIKDLLEKNGITKDVYSKHPAFIAYQRHKEYRADLLAAACNPEVAQSFITDFDRIIALHPHEQTNPSHVTHPTETQRQQAVSQLLSYMNAEKQQIVA